MGERFRHEALLYAGEDDFIEKTAPFIREGVEAGEPVLVAVSERQIERLREELNGHADGVQFRNMLEVGRNPAAIIPVWRDFVAEHGGEGHPLRGIGEPVWAGRSVDELIECEHHESLLNLAFDAGPPWTLLCPYDTETLDTAVLEVAYRTHPRVQGNGATRLADYLAPDAAGSPFWGVFPPPADDVEELRFEAGELSDVRQLVDAIASTALDPMRAQDLVLAVNEIATNTLRHTDAGGTLRIWFEDDRLVCEVSDRGVIADPLVGRRRPSLDQADGRGLWIVNQICDLVQIRSSEEGTTVRLHMHTAHAHA